MGTNTTNYNLYKPDVGEQDWGAFVNAQTLDAIDTQMKVNADAAALNTTHSTGDGSDHADVATNNAKVSNVSTNLSEGTATETTVDVNSSDGDNATLVSASTTRAGLLTKAKFDEIVANTAKVTNVSTNLSEGTATETTVDVNSSDGDNATLAAASTTRAGLLTKAKFDEIVANTAKVTNATHSSEVTGDTDLTIADNVVDEANLKLDEGPTNDYVLTADSTKSGGMKWAAGGGGSDNDLTPSPAADQTASGLTATLTAGAALAFGNICYMGSDGKMELGDADAAATAGCIAMALGTISEDATGSFLLLGFARDDAWTWGTVGGTLYLDTTAGGMTLTAPSGTGDVVQILGIATHADRVYFNPQLVQVGVA